MNSRPIAPWLDVAAAIHAPAAVVQPGSLIVLSILIMLMVGTLVASSASGSQLFAARFRSFDTGSDPTSVAIGDFNGDGRPDLVTANLFSNTVSVLLGNGDGTFAPRNDYGTGSYPNCVAIDDFNTDGRMDLAVTNYGSLPDRTSGVSVLLGNGDGTFAPTSDYAMGSVATAVAIGDLNADGKSDLAVSSYSGAWPDYVGKVSVLLGNGDGTFAPRSDYGTGGITSSVVIRDLNGDGRPDLVVVTTGTISVLLGHGDGTFGSRSDYEVGGSGAAIEDLNGDSKLDLVTTVSVLLGNGDGTFRSRSDYEAGGDLTSLAIGDFNGDGRLDLATANYYPPNVSVLLGNGDGTFGPRTSYSTGGGSASVVAGDLNADGKLDLTTANTYYANSVSVLLGNGDGTFGLKNDYPTGPWPLSVASGDFNGDGRSDLATANASSVSVLLGNGDGTFGPRNDYLTGRHPSSVAIADFNGDGRPDLAIANPDASTVSVLLGNGDGTFGLKNDYATGPWPLSAASGDFNGDGRPDLVTANSLSVSVLLGNGDGTFGPSSDYGYREDHWFVASPAIGDFNGDGALDLAVASAHANADASFVAGTRPGFSSNEKVALPSASYTPLEPTYHTVSVLLGNGDGTFGPVSDYEAVGDDCRSVAVGDLNADGRPDLAVAGVSDPGCECDDIVTVLLGNGDGTFAFMNYNMTVGGRDVAIGDLDRDGKLDLATAGYWGVSVLPGNGDGTFGPRSIYGTGDHPTSLEIGDFNRDGALDLTVANFYANAVSVLLNIGGAVQPVPVTLTLPGALNLRSLGHWVTAYLQPPAGFDASAIDVGTIRLHGDVAGAQPVPVDPAAPTTIGDQNGDSVPDLMVKFDRFAMELTLSEGAVVPVNVTGTLAGKSFRGTTTLKVLRARIIAPTAGAVLNPGALTTVRWETPAGVEIQSVALLSSLDDGANWTLVATGIRNSGNYDWTVPEAGSEHARVAVVLVKSADATGYVVEGVLGVSGAFRIAGPVSVGEEAPVEFGLRSLGPNPSRGALRMEIGLPDRQPARLEVLDVAGRLVTSRDLDALGPGRHVVDVRRGLRPGVYLVRLRGAKQKVVRVVVLG